MLENIRFCPANFEDPPLRGGPNTKDGMLRCTFWSREVFEGDWVVDRAVGEVVERLLPHSVNAPFEGEDRKSAMIGWSEDTLRDVEALLDVGCSAFKGTLLRHSGRGTGCFILMTSVPLPCNEDVLCLTLVSLRC